MVSARGDRLEPEQIAFAYGKSQSRIIPLRVEIATAVGCCVFALTIFTEIAFPFGWILALCAGAASAYVSYKRLNKSRCEWWQSEQTSELPRLSSGIWHTADHQGPEPAMSVQPGDLISNEDSKINDRLLDTPTPDSNSQTHAGEKPIELVIAKKFTLDERRTFVAVFGRDKIYQLSSSRNFVLHGHLDRRKAYQLSTAADPYTTSHAFFDLISMLNYGGRAVAESALVKGLHQQNHSVRSIRDALAVAELGRLIDRTHETRLREFAKVFFSSDLTDGHDRCFISLTDSGETWLTALETSDLGQGGADSSVSYNEYNSYSISQVAGPIHNVTNVYADHIYIWESFANRDTDLLARQLAAILDELRKREDSSKHRDDAETIKMAEAAAKRGDGPGAVSQLSRLAPVGKWLIDVSKDASAQFVVALVSALFHLPH
ncbi:MAG TPA: hypothetical protein VHZ03_18515 [Trebonia sp.]|jgi:hypothetical protein|nr:hypothetical protein [Trebonia sp.]